LAVRLHGFAALWTPSAAFGLLGNGAYVLVLVATSLDAPERASEQVPAAGFLIRITKVAVII
jgi:hypothetical protein